MILGSAGIADGTILETAICVVGAGPAGIVLGITAAEAGLPVLILESGGLRPDDASQALCAGQVEQGVRHPPAMTYRRRGLGGSSTLWGGRCVPLDPIDFEERDWLDLPSTWPIRYETLLPYWVRAHGWAELGRFEYAAAAALPCGMRPMVTTIDDDTISTEQIERFSPPTDFGRRYRKRLECAANVRVLLNATCINIALTQGGGAVRQLESVTQAGSRIQVRAGAYVLAMGGLEVPRLLLASRARVAQHLANEDGALGRFYMCHLAATLGDFLPTDGHAPWHFYQRDPDGVYCRRRFSIKASAQRTHQIGNIVARFHHPLVANPAHGSGALSLLYFGSRLLPAEYAQRNAENNSYAALQHVYNVAVDASGAARFAAHCARRRWLARRKLPSVVIAPPRNMYTLEVHAEQLPCRESRITLAAEADPLGVPKLRIGWRAQAADFRTVRVGTGLIAAALAKAGRGRMLFDPDAAEARIADAGAYGGHHLGAARMSQSAQTGVVDADCRVHGVGNLYVASGAVFPTSGQANPTLTILALALRLADHLVAQFAR